MRQLLIGTLLLLAGPAWSLDVSNRGYYVCESGDCSNGVGKARSVVTGVLYSGTWQGGKTIAGRPYELSHPAQPQQTYKAVYGPTGLQESGDMLFGLGATGRSLPVFTGSYEAIDHPFAQFKIAVPKRGQLDTGRGYRYQGRFEYLPSKDTLHSRLVSGTYIFFGTVTDVDDGTKETGLFVSNEQPNGMVPAFHKANAVFLVSLQRKYQADLELGKAVIAEQESSRRWREVLAVIGKIAFAVASGGTSTAVQGLASETAMNLVSTMLKSDDTKLTTDDATNQAIEQLASTDSEAVKELRGVISR